MTSNQHKSKAKNAASTPQLLSEAAKSAREATMATIARLVDDKAAKSGGRVPYGFYPDVIQEFAKVVPNLTRAMIKHYRGKGKRRASDLTELDANATEATLSPMTVSNDLPQDDAGPPKKRQKGGRPKGTTIENSQEEIERYKKAVAEVAQDYKNALDDVEKQALHHSSGRRHIRKGTLDRIIEYAKKKHNVDHLEIPKETIKSRVKRGCLAPSHPGLVSPMEQVEPILVELCIRLGRARQPLKCKNFIPLANSLVKGTLTEQEVIAFKARYSHGDENADASAPNPVSQFTAIETIPLDLNTTSGSAGEMFAIILREADKDELKRQREQQRESGQERVKEVEEIKRLTAGVHFNSKKLRLGATALERVRAQQQKKQAAQLKKDGQKAAEQQGRRRKAMEVRALNCPEEQWTKVQLKSMCLYKKVKGDKGLPDDMALLRQVWNERKGRLSPPVSPENSENGESDEESVVDLVSFGKANALVPATTPLTHVVLTHVALGSPAAFSTLSDLTTLSNLSNTPPMHAPNLLEGETMLQIAM
jgi:hypothetical protein